MLDLDNHLKQLKKKKEQNSLLDEKDNKDIKATITQLYDELKGIMGTGKDNPFLPDMESKNSESLALLSVMIQLFRQLRSAWNVFGKNLFSATLKMHLSSNPL